MNDKESQRAYHRAYYRAHIEKFKMRYLTHQEENKARHRAYYLAHREEANARSRAYYLAHREETRAYRRAYRLAHGEKIRTRDNAYYLIHREKRKAQSKAYNLTQYGLTPVTFDCLLTVQGGGCAICGRSEWNGQGPHVDHDHDTGKVRGILCHNCNVVLGLIHNDVNILKKMSDYISKFKYMEARCSP